MILWKEPAKRIAEAFAVALAANLAAKIVDRLWFKLMTKPADAAPFPIVSEEKKP